MKKPRAQIPNLKPEKSEISKNSKSKIWKLKSEIQNLKYKNPESEIPLKPEIQNLISSEIWNPKSEIQNWNSVIWNPKSESEIQNLKYEIQNLPKSGIQIRNPKSETQN